MFRILSSIFTAATTILPLLFAGIIIDVGLTSIYAHFGWDLWPTFAVIGGIIGLILGCSAEHWRLLNTLIFAWAGYVFAQHWMIDGIIYATIISAVYSAIESHFNPDN